jgi:hypothetical protein
MSRHEISKVVNVLLHLQYFIISFNLKDAVSLLLVIADKFTGATIAGLENKNFS